MEGERGRVLWTPRTVTPIASAGSPIGWSSSMASLCPITSRSGGGPLKTWSTSGVQSSTTSASSFTISQRPRWDLGTCREPSGFPAPPSTTPNTCCGRQGWPKMMTQSSPSHSPVDLSS